MHRWANVDIFNAQVGKWRVVSKVEDEAEPDVGETTGKNTSDDRFKYFYCF